MKVTPKTVFTKINHKEDAIERIEIVEGYVPLKENDRVYIKGESYYVSQVMFDVAEQILEYRLSWQKI